MMNLKFTEVKNIILCSQYQPFLTKQPNIKVEQNFWVFLLKCINEPIISVSSSIWVYIFSFCEVWLVWSVWFEIKLDMGPHNSQVKFKFTLEKNSSKIACWENQSKKNIWFKILKRSAKCHKSFSFSLNWLVDCLSCLSRNANSWLLPVFILWTSVLCKPEI